MVNRQKKVLIIRNAWGFGGAETYALNLALALRKNGYLPIFVTRVPELIEKCKANDIKFIRGIWYKRQGWGRAYSILEPLITGWYFFVILFYRIDIIHTQGKDDFIFATKAARMLSRKVVWTDHADLKYIMEEHNKESLRRKIIDCANYATKVIAVSNSEKKEILKQYPKFPNLDVIHNGVFLPRSIKPVSKPSKVIIGSTSRLVKAKGIAELIKAFAKAKGSDNCELWLVGDGEEKKDFKRLAQKKGISDRVKFIGYKKDIWPYLEAFDIFVQTSYHEAFSLSLIEAGIAGKAVIATDTGGNPEIINKSNGILVPVKDVEALKEALQLFISDPVLRSKKSKSLQIFAKTNFDFDKIVKE
ncbi:MAG: glycosyltransferase, partial [bacterium]|nr:glycosyltransferase [bacterium]